MLGADPEWIRWLKLNKKGDYFIRMQHKKTIIIFVVGALAIALTFGAIAYQSGFAATSTTSSTSPATVATLNWGADKGPYGCYTNEELANTLGISTDALNTAYQTAYAAALKEAVSQGLITQAQADQLTSKGSAFPFGNRWDAWLTQNGIDFDTYLADALGISVDTLKAAYQTATFANIDQAVTDGQLTQTQADLLKGRYALYNDATFQSSMQSAYISAVNAAVASGVITQSQADQILSNSNNLLVPGMGGIEGRGGPRGHGGGVFMPGGNTFQP
jgi:formaldehyde-activating enzyme involved in methanogenesis